MLKSRRFDPKHNALIRRFSESVLLIAIVR